MGYQQWPWRKGPRLQWAFDDSDELYKWFQKRESTFHDMFQVDKRLPHSREVGTTTLMWAHRELRHLL